MSYQQRIRDLREDADLTQRQVAEYLGTSQTMYARYEQGAIYYFNPDTATSAWIWSRPLITVIGRHRFCA